MVLNSANNISPGGVNLRAIAFYLPQFHPVTENDEWWGKGFTEWRNVAKANPLFPGHYQPHIPADLGFYDLRLPEAREAQAELARQYGIHGFCYYHYWFNGRRILERPFNEVLASGKPNFPFCLCWANENWTRRWDGGENDILLQQNYCAEDDLAHIQSLFPAFRDPRYIRIDGKPLFLVYRTELLPEPARTAAIWRDAARKAGIGELYLARVENFTRDIDPSSIGFDAAVQFAPDGSTMGELKFRGKLPTALARLGLISKAYLENKVFNYKSVAEGAMNRPEPAFKRFSCVTPMWDNSARRKSNARILIGSDPEKYEVWLKTAITRTCRRFQGDERIVFINAWNEWAEGCHLEPDLKWGRAYLEATRRALATKPAPLPDQNSISNATLSESSLKRLYWRINNRWREQVDLFKNIFVGRS